MNSRALIRLFVIILILVLMTNLWVITKREVPNVVQPRSRLDTTDTDCRNTDPAVSRNDVTSSDAARWMKGTADFLQKSFRGLQQLQFNILSAQGVTNKTNTSEDAALITYLRQYYWMQLQSFHDLREEDPVSVLRMSHWSETIATRLEALQHPEKCENAKFIVCDIHFNYGFGCQVHHLIYCLLVAYANNRTLVVEDAKWPYDSRGWNQYFLPVTTEKCKTFVLKTKNGSTPFFASSRSDVQILRLPMIAHVEQVPYLPLAVPYEIARDLEHVHDRLPAWWIGQLAKYLMRPNQMLQAELNRMKLKLGFRKPLIGVQVRRTDKLVQEAKSFDVNEYFSVAEELFSSLNLTSSDDKRIVHFATDEAKTVEDARIRYPNVDVLWNKEATMFASVKKRYSADSLLGIILDVLLLSECDFLICTFSSNVCRLVYELMQTKFVDASWRAHSLDMKWFFMGSLQRKHFAVLNHTATKTDELELHVDDPVRISWNQLASRGYLHGTNLRTKASGWFPFYKVEEPNVAVRLPRDGP